MIIIKSLSDLVKNKELIPEVAFLDICKRMCDWLGQEGSNLNDNYIKNQFRYAERLVNR